MRTSCRHMLSSERNRKAALHVRRLSCTQGRRNTRWRDVCPQVNDLHFRSHPLWQRPTDPVFSLCIINGVLYDTYAYEY